MDCLSRPKLDLSQLEELMHSAEVCPLVDSYEVSVVTPMFGGSVTPSEADRMRPIRSASVRGHLRFWWRATRGTVYEDVVQLRRKEVEVFGDTDQPSAVKIWVELLDRRKNEGLLKKTNFYSRDFAYILFPFGRNNQIERSLDPFKFKIHIQYNLQSADKNQEEEIKQLRLEVEAALWAWINFGGIGARTRRGCGSLYCEKFSPNKQIRSSDEFEKWLKERLEEYHLVLSDDELNREWPTLSRRIEIQRNRKSLNQAWAQTVNKYRNFRRLANRGNGKTPGRSYWPEADSIRRITGMGEPKHKVPCTISKSGHEIAFPRAQFGLPIITEFKHDYEKRGLRKDEREPYTTQLVPKAKDRLASPLILKSIAVSEKEGFGMFAVLNQPLINQLELKVTQENNRDPNIKHKLESKHIEQNEIYPKLNYPNNPMKDKSGRVSENAIKAFLDSKEVQIIWKKE